MNRNCYKLFEILTIEYIVGL